MNWTCLPFWSARVIGAIVVLLLVLAIVRWRRERHGKALLALRGLIIGLLLVIVLNPMAWLPLDRAGKPKLVILVDTSASMATPDVSGNPRLEAAMRVLRDPATLKSLNKEFILEVRRFDHEMSPAELSEFTNAPTGDSSDLGTALMSAVSALGDEKSQAGVLLVSDGRATTPGTLDAAQMALARSVPLWTWTLGGEVPRHDLWMETASSEALAFSGSEVELSATLHAVGYSNRSFKVDVLKDDAVIETKEVLPDTRGLGRITARVKAPDSGEYRYVFRVKPEPDDADTSNNERAVFLRSVGEKVRVLIVEGQPHWDTKFLVQSLKRDDHVELTCLYRLNASRYLSIVSVAGTETRVEKDIFPRTADAMNVFDVIILGRGAESFFDPSTENLLTEFAARHGGSIIFGRGKAYGGRFQALAKLEPVAWGEGSITGPRLKITEAGRDNPVFDLGASGSLDELMDRLPALDQASVTLGEKPLAVVLASAPDPEGPAILAYQRYGQGKVLSLNAAGLWRWSFRESGQDESELAYRRFWLSLMQWLLSGSQFLPGSDVALTSARRYYTSEQPMEFMISTRNLDRSIYQPRLSISANGRTNEVEPRAKGEMFVAEAGPFAQGTYHVSLRNNVGKPALIEQNVEVISASVEKRVLSADPQTMTQLAQQSGGAAVTEKDVRSMGDVVRRWEASRQLSHRQESAWDRWWMLGALLVLFGVEWWMRRREGLL
jgi:hypothetical protein